MSDYSGLTRAEIEQRLAVAEDVCVAYGWSPVTHGSDVEEATHELWARWSKLVGSEFTGPDQHVELNSSVQSLAEQRRETRRRTLDALRGES